MATFLDPLFSFGERWGTGWDAFATALYTLERDEVLRHAKACSFLRRTGHCVVCAAKKGLTLCLCVLVSCALHVAGPPCTDFSPQGGRQRHWGGDIRMYAPVDRSANPARRRLLDSRKCCAV